MKKQNNISSTEIFKSLTDPIDRREVVRWIIHDHNETSENIETIFRLALKDMDWEVRLSAMLGSVRLKCIQLLGLIQEVKLPRSTNSGLTKEELNMVIGMKNVSIDILKGATVLEEPEAINTPEEKKQYLTWIIGRGGLVKKLNNAFLLYTSLTHPAYPIQKAPGEIRDCIDHRNGRYFLDDIELMHIPEYTAFIGSSNISYHPIKLSTLPEGSFVSKNPISYDQFILENSMKTGDQDMVKCTWLEAKVYCEALSAKHKVSAYVPNMRTWETAIRGHNGRFYPWGNAYQSNQKELPNMWGLENYTDIGGEWTSNTIKGGRVIIKGNDPLARVAPMQFVDKHEVHAFRIILSGIADK